MLSHYGVLKTCWDILVLLATIYVAIVVPYNAAFHDPVLCHPDVLSSVHLVGTGSIVRSNYSWNGSGGGAAAAAENRTKREDIVTVEVEEEKKASIVMDVIVEGIFIVGECLYCRAKSSRGF